MSLPFFIVHLLSGVKVCRLLKELYIEGMIDKKEFNLRQNKTLSEVKTYSNTILGLKEKIEGFLGLLEGVSEDVLSEEKLKGLYLGKKNKKNQRCVNFFCYYLVKLALLN